MLLQGDLPWGGYPIQEETKMEKINLKNGNIIAIQADVDPWNPLEEEETYNFYTWQNGYLSITENDFNSPSDWVDSILGDGAFDRQKEKSQENNKNVVGFAYDVCSLLDKKGIYALPILLLDHSMVKYYIGDSIDPWDGSVIGFAWRDKKELCKEYGVKKLSQKLKTETIEKVVESELRAYTNFANGEAYGFELYSREDGEDPIDSCYGFIGFDSTEELFKEVLEYIPSGHKDFFKVD
jgi:hypothetical protein